MTIPSIVVQDYLYNEDGTPAVGGVVTAQLNVWELDTSAGYVSPTITQAVSDSTGLWSMELFPQTSGSTSSTYNFTLQTASTLLTVQATLPDAGPVWLRQIASQPPLGAGGTIAIPDAPSDGNLYGRENNNWVEVTGSGSGTVTSVAVAAGSNKLNVTGSPITTAGTITIDVDETNLVIPASQTTGFATVATSGSYNDLSNKPTIPTGTVTSVGIAPGSSKLTVSGSPITSSGSITVDVDEANLSLPATQITGLATVATSGSYNDLSSKPTIPTIATTSVAGTVKPDGTTITIAVDGTISATGSSPIVYKGSPNSGTQSTTTTIVQSVSIPGNTLGTTSQLRIWALWVSTGSSGTKTMYGYWGAVSSGYAFINYTSPNNADLEYITEGNVIANGSTSSQIVMAGYGTTGGWGGTGSAPYNATLDTTTSQTINFAAKVANTADEIILTSYRIELIP